MDLWLQIMLASTVALVGGGLLGLVWLALDRFWWQRRSRRAKGDEGDGAPIIIRGGLDMRDHPGPIVERRGPGIAERRYRDVIDRTSGDNPRT